MAFKRSIFLRPDQEIHESVMLAVIGRLQATPYVFKGGSALAFAYGLDRHSTDLDFDAEGPVAIKDLVEAGLNDAGVVLTDFIVGKDTEIGQRLKVHYTQPAMRNDRLLNIDLSFRETPNEDDVVMIDGIRTYSVTAIFDQKMRASVGRTRARDLFDLGFIADKFGDDLSEEQIRSAETYTRDYEALADEYRQAFPDDKTLSGVTTADDRALKFRVAIEEQLLRRGMQVIEQAVPADRSLAGVLALHQIWLGSDGQRGQRADLSGANFRGKVLVGVNFQQALLDRADFTDADLRNSDLREASLRNVNLEGANLLGADATGADLQGATIKRTMLGGSTKGVAEAVARARRERTASSPARVSVQAARPRRDDPDLSWSR